jgi:8-oxo-dGTP pyrophosphatase MutT (NUDIX family)
MSTTKVLTYITHGDRLLVFRHTAYPEAGIQVPGGTVRQGEPLERAVLREAREETGLQGLQVRAYLGARELDRSPWGLDGIERRHFFHLTIDGQVPDRWLAYELDPSDGSPAPIEFELYWVPFPDEVPELSGEQGALLDKVAL